MLGLGGVAVVGANANRSFLYGRNSRPQTVCVQEPVAPLASVIDGHAAQQGFTGVIDIATGEVLMRPSRIGPNLPSGWIPRRGGHADVSRLLGGNTSNHRGFAVILQEDGTLQITWGSGTLNSPPDYVIPTELRPEIVRSIEAATGRKVSSF
jgi:hypothetical protein